jgi:hypothetical protein
MRTTIVSLLVGVSLLSAAPGRAQDGPKLAVVLENLDGPTARIQITGEAPHLPDGTLLHIRLLVADRHPPVEAGFYRVTVRDGKYGGNHEWKQKTFAPLAYRTEVKILMEVQNPAVKRFLARELGYSLQHVEVISAERTELASVEERSAFEMATLRSLREYQKRAAAMLTELRPKLALPATDPAFQTFEADFVPRLRQALEELKTWEKTRVAWYDSGYFSALDQAFFQLDWGIYKHKEGDTEVVANLDSTMNDLQRLAEGIDSRLPAEEGGPLREPAQDTPPAPNGGR